MLFQIIHGDGWSNNAGKSGNEAARERQSQAEHDEALNYYTRNKTYSPTQVGLLRRQIDIIKGKAKEKLLPKYWDDKYPRRPITQSSGWIKSLDYNPRTNIGSIRYGNTQRSHYMTPYEAAQLVNAPSIGKIVHQKYMP